MNRIEAIRARIRDLTEQFNQGSSLDPDGPRIAAEQAMQLTETTTDPYCQARARLVMGRYLTEIGRLDEAATTLEQSEAFFRESGDRHGRAESLCRLGITHARREQFAEALAYYAESEALAQEVDDDDLRGLVQICLGIWYTIQSDAATALEWLTKAVASLERAENTQNLITAQSNIASLYARIGDFERAIEHRRHTLRMAREQGNRYKEWEMLSEIGSAYIYLEKYDEASRYLEDSLTVLFPTTDMRPLARTYRYIGTLQRKRNEYQDAYETFIRILPLIDPSVEHRLYATLCLDIGTTLAEQEKNDEALSWTLKACTLMEQGKFITELYMAYMILSTIYERLGDTRLALEYLRKFEATRQEARGTEQRRQLEQTEERIAAEKRANELQLQREASERLEREMESRAQELARLGTYAAHTNEFLEDLKGHIAEILPLTSDSLSLELTSLLNQIQTHIASDSNWHLFEEQFRQISPDFLTSIQEQLPELTPTELKLCVFMAMGLSSKEIAGILSVSVRSVETYRFRVRKKLKLTTGDDLTDYLARLRHGSRATS